MTPQRINRIIRLHHEQGPTPADPGCIERLSLSIGTNWRTVYRDLAALRSIYKTLNTTTPTDTDLTLEALKR